MNASTSKRQVSCYTTIQNRGKILQVHELGFSIPNFANCFNVIRRTISRIILVGLYVVLYRSKFQSHGRLSSSPHRIVSPSGYGKRLFHRTHASSILKKSVSENGI